MSDDENLDKLDSSDLPSEPILPLARAEWRTVPIMVAIMSFFTLVLSMVVVVYAAWEAREANIRIQRTAECIVEEFTEHREANRSAHQAFSKALDAPYALEPGGDPREAPVDLEKACKLFVRER